MVLLEYIAFSSLEATIPLVTSNLRQKPKLLKPVHNLVGGLTVVGARIANVGEVAFAVFFLVGATGFEPATSCSQSIAADATGHYENPRN
jgi:hypothetical protein